MGDIVGSISIIKNFMANASRTACNEYLYEALTDAVECMERQIPKKPEEIKPCRTIAYYKCRICGDMLSIGKNFCCNCGQALDWNKKNSNPELIGGKEE